MTTFDKSLVVLAMIGLITFNSVVLWFVREPDLIIVVSVVLCLACYDFWQYVLRAPKDKSNGA